MKRFLAVPLVLVLAGAVAVISARAARRTEVKINVTEKGFVPATVKVKAGEPVTLAVTRKTTRTCATELVLKEYDIHQKLPLNETVRITFTPKTAGELVYACGMNMGKGTIVVQPAAR